METIFLINAVVDDFIHAQEGFEKMLHKEL